MITCLTDLLIHLKEYIFAEKTKKIIPNQNYTNQNYTRTKDYNWKIVIMQILLVHRCP